jgi:hypothetical protein
MDPNQAELEEEEANSAGDEIMEEVEEQEGYSTYRQCCSYYSTHLIILSTLFSLYWIVTSRSFVFFDNTSSIFNTNIYLNMDQLVLLSSWPRIFL